MKPHRANPFVLIVLTYVTILISNDLNAAVVLEANTDNFVKTGNSNGDLLITGDLSVTKGIDFGIAVSNVTLPGIQVDYGSNKAARFSITDTLGAFEWSDNVTRKKMTLSSTNTLNLFKSDGTTIGISLDPAAGRVNLPSSGGIYSGEAAILTLGANGVLGFGNNSLAITSTTPATASNTGALTVSGGICALGDSYFSGVRVGRGGSTRITSVALGGTALQNNTSGYRNVAVGEESLLSNTTGNNNTGTGYRSLSSNTVGLSNTASGANALDSNIGGNYNTAFGGGGLKANTSGNRSTVVGFAAMFENTTGSSNVALGYDAGRYAANGLPLTGANNSIYIGVNARGQNNLDNNSVVIGTNAVGQGPNTTVIGNESTLSTRIFGNVKMGSIELDDITEFRRQMLDGSDDAYFGVSMTNGTAAGYFSTASSFGGAYGSYSAAISFGTASGPKSVALSEGSSEGQSSTAMSGGQAFGDYSIAGGDYAYAASYSEVAVGRRNESWGSATDWVDEDPLFSVGNGDFDNSTFTVTSSNAITTLKNGHTTLTNKAWSGNSPLADPTSGTDSGGEALVVEGHTRLKGKVIIDHPQGDISMGNYE